jgi:arginine decarboxylase
VIKGDTVREVLDYVQYKTESLISRNCGAAWKSAVREGRLGYEESGRLLRFYEDGLHGYTYLEDPHER